MPIHRLHNDVVVELVVEMLFLVELEFLVPAWKRSNESAQDNQGSNQQGRTTGTEYSYIVKSIVGQQLCNRGDVIVGVISQGQLKLEVYILMLSNNM